MQYVTILTAGFHQEQKRVVRLHSVRCKTKALRNLVFGIILCSLLILILNRGGGAQALAYEIQFQDASDGKYRYELHWTTSTFMGAMATCQSRGRGQGVLTPIATVYELELVSTLLLKGCCSRSHWTDESFFIGLTTLGNQHALAFLDRPRPGSSTAFLRGIAVSGQGCANGIWPDKSSLTAADVTASAAAPTALNSTPSYPLCAAVRLLITVSATEDAAAAGGGDKAIHPPVAACASGTHNLTCGGGSSSGTSNNAISYQLEVNFRACDGRPTSQTGSDGNGTHAFLCRVPAPQPLPQPPSPPPPEVAPAPLPQPLGPQPAKLLEPQPWLPPSDVDAKSSSPSRPPPPPMPQSPNNLPIAAELNPPGPVQTAATSQPPPGPGFLKAPLIAPPMPSGPVLEVPPTPSTPSPSPGDTLSPLNATTGLTAALIKRKCDAEVLDVGGVAMTYLACHVTATWSESAELCEDLLPGGTLAVFESQTHMDSVARAFSAKDLGGLQDFWFGLVSGASLEQPSRQNGPPLEYILTDPRVTPILPSQLWANGAIEIDSSCMGNEEQPEPPFKPSPVHPAPATQPAPTDASTSAPMQHGSASVDAVPAASNAILPPPSPSLLSNATLLPLKPPLPLGLVSTAVEPLGPTPPPPAVAIAIPRPSGCCASLTILPVAAAAPVALTYSPLAGTVPLLRACHQRVKFTCQAPVAEASPVIEGPDASSGGSGGGATTLLASLFLDALEGSYKGAYRVFRAQLELRLAGVSYGRLSGGDGDLAVEDFRNQTAGQLALATQLPLWSFMVLGLRSGSVVAALNLTVRGLPRTTLANFSDFVSAALMGKQSRELFSSDYIQAWNVKGCNVTILALTELGDSPSPAGPAHRRDNRTLILIPAVVGGMLLVGLALGLLLLLVRRFRMQQRRVTRVYFTSLADGNGDGREDDLSLQKALSSPLKQSLKPLQQPPQQQQHRQQLSSVLSFSSPPLQPPEVRRSASNQSLGRSRTAASASAASASAASAATTTKPLSALQSWRRSAVGRTSPQLQPQLSTQASLSGRPRQGQGLSQLRSMTLSGGGSGTETWRTPSGAAASRGSVGSGGGGSGRSLFAVSDGGRRAVSGRAMLLSSTESVGAAPDKGFGTRESPLPSAQWRSLGRTGVVEPPSD